MVFAPAADMPLSAAGADTSSTEASVQWLHEGSIESSIEGLLKGLIEGLIKGLVKGLNKRSDEAL
jgi:hypothetical protein